MSETRSLSERGDELGRVLFEAFTRDLRWRQGIKDEDVVSWDEVAREDREVFRDAALAVAFAAVEGG